MWVGKIASLTNITLFSKIQRAGCWWFMPVILAAQEAEIRRISDRRQPQANSSQDPISKKPS
jgi:hypothetical protein